MDLFQKLKGTLQTWRTSCAPYVPSEPEVVRKMLELARVGPEDVVYDLGCGDGRILVMAVKEFGAKKAVGYELSQRLYESTLKKIESMKLRSKINLINRNLFEADLSQATVITLYLTTSGNKRLQPKLVNEAKPGTRIVSHDFMIEGWQASNSVQLTRYTDIHLYIISKTFDSSRGGKSPVDGQN